MTNHSFPSLDSTNLATVTGGTHDGDGGALANPGECVDNVWPWAAGGALAGPEGAALGGGAAYMTSTACGDGKHTPATNIRNGMVNAVKSSIVNWGKSILPGGRH